MNSKIRKSLQYIFFGNIFSKIISFAGSILLARLLFPDDYGYLLKAQIITGFIQIVGNVGFENFYLQEPIQSEEYRKKILDITSKLRFLLNFILFILQFLISYLIEYYLNSPIVARLLRIFSFIYIINAITQINMYILRKELDYRIETLANVTRDLASTFFKVLFAWLGLGALSFAYGALIGNFLRMLVFIKHKFYLPSKWKNHDPDIFKKVIFFGKHSFFVGVLSYFNNQLDKMFVSKYFTNKEVGFYSFSNQYSLMPFNYLAAPFASFFLSYSANRKENKKLLFDKLIQISKILIFIFTPITIFLFFYASEIFHFLFSDKWNQAIPYFKVLLLYYFFTLGIFYPFIGLITAHGRPDILTKISLSRLITMLLILSLALHIKKSLYTFLIVFVIISTFFYWIKVHIGLKFLNKKLWNVLFRLKKEIIVFGILFLFTSFLKEFSPNYLNLIIGFFLILTYLTVNKNILLFLINYFLNKKK